MKIREYLENSLPQMKSALERLVKIPSVSGEKDGDYPFGKECGRVLDEFLKLCEENGFTSKNYANYAASADFMNAEENNTELGILAHLDVVPVNEKDWSVPPYQMTEKDGKLYGRQRPRDRLHVCHEGSERVRVQAEK